MLNNSRLEAAAAKEKVVTKTAKAAKVLVAATGADETAKVAVNHLNAAAYFCCLFLLLLLFIILITASTSTSKASAAAESKSQFQIES